MAPISIAAIAFGLIFGGSLVGLLLGRILPEHHSSTESLGVVRLSMGLIATITALVLSLVTSSAKTGFDTENATVKQTAASILTFDRMLANYGPEATPIRQSLRTILTEKAAKIWPEEGIGSVDAAAVDTNVGEHIVDQILALQPQTDAQRWYQSQALDLCSQILQTRWIVYGGSGGSIPTLFLTVMIGWLVLLFGSFGLFAPLNGTVVGALLIGTLTVATSIFLILEMDEPFNGLLKVSSDPIQYTLARLSHYTGTDAEHFQNFVIFTNYAFYIDEFCRLAKQYMADGHPDYDASGGVPALQEVLFSLTSSRGCFGACNYPRYWAIYVSACW